MSERTRFISFSELGELAGHVVVFDMVRRAHLAARVILTPLAYMEGSFPILADCDELLAAARVGNRLQLAVSSAAPSNGRAVGRG